MGTMLQAILGRTERVMREADQIGHDWRQDRRDVQVSWAETDEWVRTHWLPEPEPEPAPKKRRSRARTKK